MNFSTRLAEKLPGILPVPSHPLLRKGAIIPELRFFATASHSRRLRLGLQKNKVWSLQRAELCVVTSLCIVHPATEAYAQEAIEAIKSEKVIAVPTDTLYGFACDAWSIGDNLSGGNAVKGSLEAVNRIYEIKGRKLTSPLAICVGDVLDIKRVATTNHLPHGLLDSLLPGPVTLVLQRGESSILEKSLNPGIDTIGVRVPDSEFIREVSRGSGSVLALTSANLSGDRSSVCVNDFENLWQHCAYVYDGGLLPSGRAGSTIVDLSKVGKYKIIRPGSAKEATVAILEKYLLEEEEDC
ncbi:hypothetical protein YC2023_123129 [Brassica napus]